MYMNSVRIFLNYVHNFSHFLVLKKLWMAILKPCPSTLNYKLSIYHGIYRYFKHFVLIGNLQFLMILAANWLTQSSKTLQHGNCQKYGDLLFIQSRHDFRQLLFKSVSRYDLYNLLYYIIYIVAFKYDFEIIYVGIYKITKIKSNLP